MFRKIVRAKPVENDLCRREFLGGPVTPQIEDVHPLPWTVRPHTRYIVDRYKEIIFLIVDAQGRCVAECDKQHVAWTIVEAVTARVNARLHPPTGTAEAAARGFERLQSDVQDFSDR